MPSNEPEDIRPNRRILIVDDNPSIHEDYRRILESRADEDSWAKMRTSFFGQQHAQSITAPFELDYAFQGEQACAKVANALQDKEPYAVAFIDVRMPPGIDGVETLHRIWEIDPKLQAVICSAYSDYSLEDLHNRLDSSDNMLLLKKPFEAIVVKQIAEALCRKWSLSEANALHTSKLKHAYEELSKKITERDQIQQQLDIAMRCSQMGSWHWDPTRERMHWDKNMSELFGFPHRCQQSTLAEFCTYFNSSEALPAFYQQLNEANRPHAHFALEATKINNNAEDTHLIFKGSYTETPDGPRIAGVTWDITDQKHAEDRLKYLSVTDPLTEFANRQYFIDEVEDTLLQFRRLHEKGGESSDFILMFIDLDEFKNINDSRGHLFGDQLLRKASHRLTEISSSGYLLARLGGDEFSILIKEPLSDEQVAHYAERLLEAIRQPFQLHDEEFYLTASIGIVRGSMRYLSAIEMLRDADNAMYRAKLGGKDQYCQFDAQMLDQANRRINLESNLRKSIAARELQLYYQPIASLETGTIEGYEALLRWQPKGESIIPPAEFIPIAEESGLIHEIGLWVLRQASLWIRSSDQPQYISVNLSPIQIFKPNLVESISAILEESGLDPHRLRLEITENAIITQPARAIRTLNRLKETGIRIWLDDFGTGYSSLSYLNSLPLNGIKVDRSFINDMEASEQNLNLTHTIVQLGKDLGLSVVAEGIETESQLDHLKKMGCILGQGYLLGRPTPLESPQDPIAT